MFCIEIDSGIYTPRYPFAFDIRLNQIPEEWHHVAVRFRQANGIRDGDMERSIWQLR